MKNDPTFNISSIKKMSLQDGDVLVLSVDCLLSQEDMNLLMQKLREAIGEVHVYVFVLDKNEKVERLSKEAWRHLAEQYYKTHEYNKLCRKPGSCCAKSDGCCD